MSFQFSPQALLLQLDRTKVILQSQAEAFQSQILSLEKQLSRSTLSREKVNIQRGLRIIKERLSSKLNEVTSLENSKLLLIDEINIRNEVTQPTDVDLETGEISTAIEVADISKGIDVKTVALIGGAILLLA